MQELKTNTSQEITFRGWSGEVTHLERIARAIDEVRDSAVAHVAQSYRNSRVTRREADVQERRKWSTDAVLPEGWTSEWERTDEARLLENLDAVHVEMSVRQGFRTIEGPPSVVLPLIDSTEIVGHVSFTLRGNYQIPVPELRVTLSERQTTLTASGQEDTWVLSAIAKLQPIINKNRPPYLRARKLGYFVGLVPTTAIVWTVAVNVPMDPVLVGVLIYAAVCVPFALVGPWRKLFPVFELRPVGAGSRTAKSFKTIATVCLWLLSTIGIPVTLEMVLR
jgi:hypothetical protein